MCVVVVAVLLSLLLCFTTPPSIESQSMRKRSEEQPACIPFPLEFSTDLTWPGEKYLDSAMNLRPGSDYRFKKDLQWEKYHPSNRLQLHWNDHHINSLGDTNTNAGKPTYRQVLLTPGEKGHSSYWDPL